MMMSSDCASKMTNNETVQTVHKKQKMQMQQIVQKHAARKATAL
jgi:hypothetical protein